MDKISPFLVLIATVAAAIAAYMSFWVSRRILYYQILSRYSSSEMGEALEIMWYLFNTRKEEEGVFFEVVKMYRNKEDISVVYWPVEGESKKPYQIFLDYKEINQARRQITQFFTITFDMFSEMKVLDRYSFKKICDIATFKLLYHVVEWFEVAQATSWEYDQGEFTKLLEQSGRKDIKALSSKGVRPPPSWAEVEQMIQSKQK